MPVAAAALPTMSPTNNQYLAQQMNAPAPSTSVNLSGLFPGNAGLSGVLNQLQSAQNAANQANQTRYQDILGMYSNLGQSAATQIQQQTQQAQGQNTQNMTDHGLGNTTVSGAMNNQIASYGQQNLLGLQDQLTGQEANAMMQMNQQGPNLSQYAGLLGQAAMGQPKQTTVSNPGNWEQGQQDFNSRWGGGNQQGQPQAQTFTAQQLGVGTGYNAYAGGSAPIQGSPGATGSFSGNQGYGFFGAGASDEED